MTDHVATTTQTAHPWRTTVRTVFQVVITLAAATPFVLGAVADGDGSSLGAGAVVALSVAGAITRVMSLPVVNDFITRFIPFLAAEPKE